MRAGRALLTACLVIVSCAPATALPTAVATSTPPETPAATASPSAVPVESPLATASPSPSPLALPRCTVATPPDVVAYCLKGARVDIDAAVGERDAAAVLAQVGEDLAAVEREFEWTLKGTPRIDVYASRDRYVAGLMGVFGYPRATAEYLADNSVAFFEPSLTRIAVSWDAVRDRRPIAALRHELTHVVTLEACAPRCDLVPAWLNEGQARLAEAMIPGADWRLMRVRYEAASMVATATLIPLTALWTQSQWNSLGDWEGYYKYQEAARATELLRADIGDRAIARLYERIRAGVDVARAYASLSGRSFESFLAALSSRVTSEIAPGPRIEVITPGADGHGASFLLYGFPAEAHVALRIRARHADETQDIVVSPQGAHFGSIDDSYPPGEYTLNATAPGITANATVIKRGGRTSRTVAD